MSKVEAFFKLKEPYFHLLIGEKSLVSKLINSEDDTGIIRQIEGEKCGTLDNLFLEFARTFKFPDYFGNNWAAFDECLNDLDWLSNDVYLLFLTDVDKVLTLSENSFNVFIETLSRSVKEWTEGRNYDSFPTPPTPFHIVFHCTNGKESEVETRLAKAGLEDIDILSINS